MTGSRAVSLGFFAGGCLAYEWVQQHCMVHQNLVVVIGAQHSRATDTTPDSAHDEGLGRHEVTE